MLFINCSIHLHLNFCLESYIHTKPQTFKLMTPLVLLPVRDIYFEWLCFSLSFGPQVGHNIYILAYQLAQHKKELKTVWADQSKFRDKATDYYVKHTAQIEVQVQWCGHLPLVCHWARFFWDNTA